MTRRIVAALGALAIVATIAVILSPPSAQPSVVRVAILAFGAVGAWLLLGHAAPATRSTPERFEQELRRPVATSSEVPSLRTIDTTLRMAAASAFGVEFMLKPLLHELVAWRLARERNIDLATAPGPARDAMGESLWALIHVEDPTRDHSAPGITLAELDAAIDRLERI